MPRSALCCIRFTKMLSFLYICLLLLWQPSWIRVHSSHEYPVPKITFPPFALSCIFHYTIQFSSPQLVIDLTWSNILAPHISLKLSIYSNRPDLMNTSLGIPMNWVLKDFNWSFFFSLSIYDWVLTVGTVLSNFDNGVFFFCLFFLISAAQSLIFNYLQA